MREESRPVLGPVIGIIAGAVPAYWAAVELWVVWRTSVHSKLVALLVAGHTGVTAGVISNLRQWFAAVLAFEALIVLCSILVILFPRRHLLLGLSQLLSCAIGFVLLYDFPYTIGKTELLDGLIIFPVLGFIAGISGVVFRSDLEFARAYGFD